VMSDRVSKSKIPEALDALRALGAKELDDVSARDAIRKMRRQIERVLRLGYTYEEVSTTLAGLDINISGERIKYLLNDIRKKTRKKSKSSKGDDEIESETDINVGETDVSSEMDETSEIKKSSSSREIAAASTSPTVVENNQFSSTVSPDKKTLATSKNKKNNTHDNNTNSLAFQPQLIDDDDL
jgi:hypothetical protein